MCIRDRLEVKDLNVSYGAIHAIKNISFEVNEGEIITLIGANGAGKTTTLHAVSGLLKPKSGSIHFCGKEITHTDAYKIPKPLSYTHLDVYKRQRSATTGKPWLPLFVKYLKSRQESLENWIAMQYYNTQIQKIRHNYGV